MDLYLTWEPVICNNNETSRPEKICRRDEGDAEFAAGISGNFSTEISPLAALAIITHIHLASRHRAVGGDLTEIAIDCAKQLQSLFNPNSVTYEVLELGWNPEEDIPLAR